MNFNYSYYENVRHDVETLMDENDEFFFGLYADFKNETIDEWVCLMCEALWDTNCVTGGERGSYTFGDSEAAKKIVLSHLDEVHDAVSHYIYGGVHGTSEEASAEIVEHWLSNDWEWLDVMVRQYWLTIVLYDIAEDLDRNNMEMNGEYYFKH